MYNSHLRWSKIQLNPQSAKLEAEARSLQEEKKQATDEPEVKQPTVEEAILE